MWHHLGNFDFRFLRWIRGHYFLFRDFERAAIGHFREHFAAALQRNHRGAHFAKVGVEVEIYDDANFHLEPFAAALPLGILAVIIAGSNNRHAHASRCSTGHFVTGCAGRLVVICCMTTGFGPPRQYPSVGAAPPCLVIGRQNRQDPQRLSSSLKGPIPGYSAGAAASLLPIDAAARISGSLNCKSPKSRSPRWCSRRW